MCTGRIDPQFILSAYQKGMDGVLICGCHPGDCHYISGNLGAQVRFELLKKTLVQLGLEPERLRLEWISAQESEKLADVVLDMTERVRALDLLDWPDLDYEDNLVDTNLDTIQREVEP